MGYADRTIGEFTAAVASRKVSPAGGTAAAVVGATGASLCEMVCLHAVGGDPADEFPDRELADAREELATQRRHLLRLADADAAAVDDLFGGTESGPRQAELKRATGVPLTVAEACLNVLETGTVALEAGTERTVADGVTGVLLAHAALRAAVYTVRTNLEYVDDASFAERLRRRTAEVETAAGTAVDLATPDTDGFE